MAPEGAAGPFPFRILIVDDDPDLAFLYAEVLRDRGYVVHLAANGFEALRALRLSLPDLVITDLCMPGMSGLELLSVLRRRFPELPLLAVSGSELLAMAVESADAALSRGESACQQVCEQVAQLVRLRARRNQTAMRVLPWVPLRSGRELQLTCVECLRSFHLGPEAVAGAAGEVHTCACPHCESTLSFVCGEEAA